MTSSQLLLLSPWIVGEVWVWRLGSVLLRNKVIRPPVCFSGFVAESLVGLLYWNLEYLCSRQGLNSCCFFFVFLNCLYLAKSFTIIQNNINCK